MDRRNAEMFAKLSIFLLLIACNNPYIITQYQCSCEQKVMVANYIRDGLKKLDPMNKVNKEDLTGELAYEAIKKYCKADSCSEEVIIINHY